MTNRVDGGQRARLYVVVARKLHPETGVRVAERRFIDATAHTNHKIVAGIAESLWDTSVASSEILW